MGKLFVTTMEEQFSSNQVPAPEAQIPQPSLQVPASVPGISLAMLEQMKARAREEAIRITMEQRAQLGTQIPQQALAPKPNIIYARRNLTVAELLLTLLLACGIVTGVQYSWKAVSNLIPHVEIKVK